MTRAETLEALAAVQGLIRGLVADADEATYRRQYHPDLSALGWHLGHCVYVECYWLHERLRGDNRITAPVERLLMPPYTPKPERGPALPPRHELLAWAERHHHDNLAFLAEVPDAWRGDPLLRDEYLQHFLIQHASQHYETMLMVLTQRALALGPGDFIVDTPLTARAPACDTARIPAGRYRIGGEPPAAYDNEVPAQHAALDAFDIARRPVSNAEYLAFMEDGGYRRAALWGEPGRDWLTRTGVDHPDAWARDRAGNWCGVGARGAYALADDEPVLGLCHHEADAFARWAGAALPHEYQWEAAARNDALAHTGRAWEWCANPFHPYAGFHPFPYDEYSVPWFNGGHYTLRGGSPFTRPAVRRVSFRNFYEADKRHVFAGLRLVY